MTRWIFLLVVLLAAIGCRSTDKLTQLCEDNYSKCNLSCTSTNARFNTSKTAQQGTQRCDLGCDKTYQACLKHEDNKNIRMNSEY